MEPTKYNCISALLFTTLLFFQFLNPTKLEAKEETLNFKSFTPGKSEVVFNATNFSVTLCKGSSSTNPQWYDTNKEARIYAGGNLVVESSYTITKIVYNFTPNAGSNGQTPSITSVEGASFKGTWDENNKTWNGQDTKITLLTSGTAGNLGFKSITVTFTRENEPSYTAMFYNDGQLFGEPQVLYENDIVTFPNASPSKEGATFIGWSESEILTPQDESPIMVIERNMGTENLCFYAVYATLNTPEGETYTDILNKELTGVTSTTYTTWNNKQSNSPAIYQGYTAASENSIQMNTTNSNSGIIATTSGGNIRKISIKWDAITLDGRVLNIYGSTEAYNSIGALFDNKTNGTLLGSLKKGQTELIINQNYQYLGIRSNDGALYINTISIEWNTGDASYYTNYTTGLPANREQSTNLVATDGNNYFATFSSNKDVFMIADGVYAVSKDGEKLKFNELDKTNVNGQEGYWIPATNAVLICNKGYDLTSYVYETATTPQITQANCLIPTTADGYFASDNTQDEYYYYKLAYNNYESKTWLGFYWGEENGTAHFQVKAGGAVLKLPKESTTSGDAPAQGFAFTEDLFTAIATPKAVQQHNHEEEVYNIAGQRVNGTGVRGIFIKGNRKYIK